ncbi:hypothetical protein FRC08_014947 [Ceratobasidium sp. 394]|nr:hypothetical protein FRC08_014947 [Ceratobasidium sp. 394]KAG9098824.1 hypothetical protein FS749_002885 [Ceratobasidium sp. UAMH 11750]
MSLQDMEHDSDAAPNGRQGRAWWRNALSATGRSLNQTERNRVVQLAPAGKTCLVTRASGPEPAIECCHLIPKSTKLRQLKRLQYTFGRPLSLKSRWFCLFLRADLHASFDLRNRPGWALIPVKETVVAIKEKMDQEMARRKTTNEVGPWPDFRSAEWFPARRDTYRYIFVPLYISDQVFIHRLKDDPTAEPRYQEYPWPYDDFPTLTSHVHPYAAILNAVPKIWSCPRAMSTPLLRDIMLDLTSIYSVLMLLYAENEPESTLSSGTPTPTHSETHSHHPPPAATRAPLPSHADPEPRHQTRSKTRGDTGSASSGSHGDPGGQQRMDPIFDTVSASSRSSLSISIPTCSARPEGDLTQHRPVSLPEWCLTCEPQTVADWVADVEKARRLNLLEEPSQCLESVGRYTAEPARVLSIKDWHRLTSRYAQWWVPLPDDGSVLSSNDWAESMGYPSLTRSVTCLS